MKDMKKTRTIIVTLLLALLPAGHVTGSGVNPSLAAAITVASNQAEQALKAQLAAQGLMTEGHVFIGREVNAATNFQREFNKYLDRFHDVIWTAAELYGTYHEIKKTTEHVSNIASILSHQPENSLAILLTPDNNIYTDLIQTSLKVGQEIYSACLTKDKRTEGDRNEILDRVRKRIRDVNKKLVRLEILLRYTTIDRAWYSLIGRILYFQPHKRADIIDRCYRNWRLNIITNI